MNSSGRKRKSPRRGARGGKRPSPDTSDPTPRKLLSEFLEAVNPRSTVKQPARKSAGLSRKQQRKPAVKPIVTPVSRKRGRTSLSQRTAHTLMKGIVQRDPILPRVLPNRRTTQAQQERAPQSILKKPSAKFPSPNVSPTDLELRKSKRRSVSFRDEQLNVPLTDLSLSFSSETGSSLQWLPNRQRGDVGHNASAETVISASDVIESDDVPSLEREVVVGVSGVAASETEIEVELNDVSARQRGSDVGLIVDQNEEYDSEQDVEEEVEVEDQEEGEDEEAQASSGPSKRPARRRHKPTPLRRTFVKQQLMHFSKRRLSKEAVDVAMELVDKFYDQLIGDLDTYCLHAKRKTIEKADFELHLRRIQEIHDKKSLDALILERLPAEYWGELLPLPLKKKKR